MRAVRLDKYLKVSRIIKRRTLAQQLCLAGHVKKNGRVAKPSSEIEAGDVLEVTSGSRTQLFKVLKTTGSADKRGAGEMYETIAGSDSKGCDASV